MRYKRFANSVLAGVLAAALIAVSPVSVPAEGTEGSVVEENAVNISNTDSNDSRDNEENGTLEAINSDTADNNGGTAIGEEIRAVQE